MACYYRGVNDETRTHVGGMDHPSAGAFSLPFSFSSLFFLTGRCATAAGDLDERSLKSWLRVLQPHAMAEDLAAFALPPGIVPLCEDGALFRQVLRTMSSWDTVGPVRATARGPLRIPGVGEAREARPRPSSSVSGARRTRDHRSPDPEDRATGKQPRLEVAACSSTVAESSSAVVVR